MSELLSACNKADWVGGACLQGLESDLFYIVESGEFEATFSQVEAGPSMSVLNQYKKRSRDYSIRLW